MIGGTFLTPWHPDLHSINSIPVAVLALARSWDASTSTATVSCQATWKVDPAPPLTVQRLKYVRRFAFIAPPSQRADGHTRKSIRVRSHSRIAACMGLLANFAATLRRWGKKRRSTLRQSKVSCLVRRQMTLMICALYSDHEEKLCYLYCRATNCSGDVTVSN